MNLYSRTLVFACSWPLRKAKGFIALYRLRSLISGVGKNSRCALSTEIKFPDNIQMGDFVWIGANCTLGGHSGIKLADYVRVSKGVTIESAGLSLTKPLPYKHQGKPIVIEKGAWVGANAIILAGVTIGAYSVIGAGAVVSKDVKPHSIVVGQPYREVGKNTL